MREKAPFKLLYNNDTTNTAGIPSPWHEQGEPFREEMLVASIDEVAGTGVDAYMLSPGMGWVPWWQSTVDPGFYDWWRKRTGLEVEGWNGNGYDRYVADGGDMVQVLVDTCRKRGMAPFVSLRLNDVHLQENYVLKNQRSLVSCRLYVEHPEWHIDPNHPKIEGYYKRRGMNWAIPEVREYKLALLRELARKYDLAGLELDFLRDDTLFRDETPQQDRIAIISEFVGLVRAALDAQPGPRRWLCVRIPQRISAHGRIGLDVPRLHEAGVDMFNLSGWYHTIQRADIADVRRLAPDSAIYQEMTHSTGNHGYFLKDGNYGTNADPRTSDHQYYTTAALALAHGADGLSLFNFVYYRMGLRDDIPVMEPPFHVLSRLTDTAFLGRQHRAYMLARTCYYPQVPRRIEPHASEHFQMDMLKPAGPATSPAPARLRLHMLQPGDDNLAIQVAFNGQTLEPSADVSRFFGNPFDGMISPPSHRRAWTLPQEIIVDGLNDICVSTPSRPIEVIYIDCGIQ